MPSLDQLVGNGLGSPVTHGEMQALLKPLCSSIQSVEDMLRELSSSLLPAGVANMECMKNSNLRALANSALPGNGTCTNSFQQGGPGSEGKAGKDDVPSGLEEGFLSRISLVGALEDEETDAALELQLAQESTHAKCEPEVRSSQTSVPLAHTESVLKLGESKGCSTLDRAYVKRELHHANLPTSNSISSSIINQSYMDIVALKFEKCLEWWGSLEEPKHKSWIFGLASSQLFETACVLAIMLNSGLVAYTVDWQIQHIGEHQPAALDILEFACFVYFLFELIVRLAAHRLFFFLNKDMNWNIFDFVLVSISLVDFIVSRIVVSDSKGSNVVFMRLVRLLKLARIIRSFRSFRFFRALAVLLESFQKSMNALFWGLVMLAFVLYLFSLIFMQALIECLNDGGRQDPDLWGSIDANFGSLGKTLLSLYMSVTGGEDWSKYYHIMSNAGPIYSTLFVSFTFFFIFALFNIVTASLVEKAIVSSKPDRTELILDQRRRFAEQKEEFFELCQAMDTDGNGTISRHEFHKCLCNPVMLAYMASIGITIHDVELFFDTVGARRQHGGADGRNGFRQGEITIEHFVEGCMHMKGSATAIDMQRQLFELHLLQEDVRQLDTVLVDRLQRLERVVLQCCITEQPTKTKKRNLMSL